MKRTFKIFITLLLFIIAPTVCFATQHNSQIGGQSGNTPFQKCAPNCKGIIRVNNFIGVRVTFIDENGNAVAASGTQSFDYITYNKNSKTKNVYYNGFGGDRNKLSMSGGGNFSSSSVGVGNFKLFSEVVKAYNDNAATTDYPSIRATGIPETGFTGGANWNYEKEKAFFRSLTGRDTDHVPERVNSFIKAIASVSGGFNADDLLYKITEGCGTGDNIYIALEPLFLWLNTDTSEYYFGSLADSYHFFGQVINKTQELLYKIDYDDYINDVFRASEPSTPSRNKITIQTAADLLRTDGFAIGIDWANDPASYCGSCEYKDGFFTYDNKMYPGNLEIPSSFRTIQEFAFTKRDNGGGGCCTLLEPQIKSMPAEWQKAYEELCDEPDGDPNCCNEDPIEPGWIDGTVHNCCEDGGNSEAHEYDLDKLFCYDGDLLVSHYYPKCKTDYYVDENTDLNAKYCKMFCTERVSVEIPGSITATSGRYFQLSTTSKGTKSPYIEGFRRCRVRVQYDVWEDDYRDFVVKQKDSYNDFQYNETQHLIYESGAKNEQSITGQVNLSVSCKTEERNKDTNGDGKIDYKDSLQTTCTDTQSAKYSYSYKLYTFDITSKYYHTVMLDQAKLDDFSEYKLMYDRTHNVTHSKYSTYDLKTQVENAQKALDQLETSCGCRDTTNKTRDKLPHESSGYPNEDVPAIRDDFKGKAERANSAYNDAAREAKHLEEELDKCDYYFEAGKLGGPYKGANAEENYNFDASMSFSYTQVYMDNEKGLLLDEQYINFEETPGCVITGPFKGPDAEDKLSDRIYSTGDYGKAGKYEKLQDFKEATLQHKESPTGFMEYRDEPYEADKVFTHDAKYRAECSWDEGENIYYTLTPNGGVSEDTDVINFTEHGQEYKLHLSTLDGTYETHWNVSGLGTDNKFDNFFNEQGNSCANESPSESSMFTCKLHVEYEIVLTGYCNGSNGTDTTVDVADCDPYKEGYNLFAFRVVDSTNLFPNGFNTEAGEVAYNWSSTEKGQAALAEIQARGAADKTYARENITYSFVLSPTDMGHIKNYNVEANIDGGYSDFNMDCSCSGNSCINCKSRFLNELANGNVTYDGQGHSVTGWGNSQTSLDGVRRKYGW